MHYGMSNTRVLKVRRYADRLIDLNEYVTLFPGEMASGFSCVTELNGSLLNSMPNIWIKQTYVQVFDF